MPLSHLPKSLTELREVIVGAVADNQRLDIRGGGTKATIGRETPESAILDMGGFTGIVDYDPAELVLTLRAGTPLADVQALVAAEGQMLAFDPFDHAALLAASPARATIGGIVAAGVAGPLRISAGGARDHVLGFEAVSGRGERFVAGGRVVKNVTGYDLSKLIAGSWGRLVALTQLTLKVLPRPRTVATLLIPGLSAPAAVSAMARGMGSQAEVSAAAHLPDSPTGPVTALRIHGFAASVDARCAMLDDLFCDLGPLDRLDEAASIEFWRDVALAAPLPAAKPLWRIVARPRCAPALVKTVSGSWMLDWAGGLIWLASDADPAIVRAAAIDAGGHAVLIRANAEMRKRVPAFHPQPDGVARLEERVRRAFDPSGIFETGRF